MKRKRSLEYTCTYKSELGNILLAADEIGLTGLWFEGQKYFANTLPEEHISQETPILTDAKKNGWIYIFQEKNRNLLLLFIQLVQHSDRQYGRFYCRYLMDRQLYMEKSPDKCLKCRILLICLRRQ